MIDIEFVIIFFVALLLAGCARHPPDAGQSNPAGSAGTALPGEEHALAALSEAAKCGHSDEVAHWCDVVSGWPSGAMANLDGVRALVGLRVDVGSDVEEAVRHRVRLVAVAIETEGTARRASITELIPDTDDERAELATTLDEVQSALDHSRRARLPPHLFRFITATGTAKHPLSATPSGYRFEARHPSELRWLGHEWGVIETSTSTIFLVSVLVEAEEAPDAASE